MRLSKSPSLSLAHLLLSLTLIPLVQAQRKQCPKPVITYPIQGSTVNSRRVDIQGTTSLECLDLLIDIGHPYGPYQSARAAPDGTFTLPMSFDYGYNQYIQLEASNRTDTSYSSTYADGVEFTIDTVQPCLDSTIDYIPVVSWYGNQLYLTGEYLWYPTCDNITPFLNGVQWVDSTITASNGRWTILLDNVPDGRHTFTFASGTGEAHVLSRQSLGVEVFTGLCDPPTIETPSVGQIFNTRTPIFNGLRTTQQYAACNTVEYEIDGVYADRNQAGSTTWTLYIGEPGLAEGDHTLRVRHPGVASPPTGPWSAPVPFKIVLGSTPTVSLLRDYTQTLSPLWECSTRKRLD